MSMKLALTISILPSLLSGCNTAFWGNIAVLGITFGIFFGTLSLGRASDPTRSAERSASSGSHRS